MSETELTMMNLMQNSYGRHGGRPSIIENRPFSSSSGGSGSVPTVLAVSTVSVPAIDGRAGRILVADDEAKNRKLFLDILEAQGHHVTLAEDGQQALENALANPPDVIL